MGAVALEWWENWGIDFPKTGRRIWLIYLSWPRVSGNNQTLKPQVKALAQKLRWSSQSLSALRVPITLELYNDVIYLSEPIQSQPAAVTGSISTWAVPLTALQIPFTHFSTILKGTEEPRWSICTRRAWTGGGFYSSEQCQIGFACQQNWSQKKGHHNMSALCLRDLSAAQNKKKGEKFL